MKLSITVSQRHAMPVRVWISRTRPRICCTWALYWYRRSAGFFFVGFLGFIEAANAHNKRPPCFTVECNTPYDRLQNYGIIGIKNSGLGLGGGWGRLCRTNTGLCFSYRAHPVDPLIEMRYKKKKKTNKSRDSQICYGVRAPVSQINSSWISQRYSYCVLFVSVAVHLKKKYVKDETESLLNVSRM